MGINMRKLLNTLYITSEDAYLSLNGECVVITINKTEKHMVPLHTLQSIVCFSYAGASPALMGKCAEKKIMISFFSPSGKYLASSFGNTNGNVFLRHEQYRIADDATRSLVYAKNFVFSKLYNARYFLLKFCRDYPLRIDVERVRTSAEQLKLCLTDAQRAGSADTLRGIEGSAASAYFDSFNELILQNQSFFRFRNRSRRPPLDRTNALLSFAYTLLANDCAAALHGVGLDPYVGFMHTERSGRKSLALDLMEELRTIYADRFVVTLHMSTVLLACFAGLILYVSLMFFYLRRVGRNADRKYRRAHKKLEVLDQEERKLREIYRREDMKIPDESEEE